MSFPSKNDILIGIFFVIFGLIYTLCDRWLVAVKFTGKDSPHVFDHLTVMWVLKQLLQSSLFLLFMAIDKNWLGCARFKHGDIVQRANLRGNVQGIPRLDNNHAHVINNDESYDGNGHLHEEPHCSQDADAGARAFNDDSSEDNDAENEDIQDDKRELLPLPDDKNRRNVRKNKTPSVILYLPPAIFAQAHVMLLYFGLKLTYSSSFIMLKGTVTLFTALLSMAFLAQQLLCYVWFGVLVAALGFAVSGISDYIHVPGGGYEKYGIAAGNLLIVMAQIMFATKIIYEEKFIRKHSIHPMKFLGFEALYGIIFAVILLITFNLVGAAQYSDLPNQRLEDIEDAIYQFRSNFRVVLAVLGSLVCYIFYTYLGLFLIRDHGALPRIMIETLIWGFYWVVCLILNWEHFFIAQVPGLCIIAIGVLIYSHILVLPFSSRLEGIDTTGGGLKDQFMDLDRPDNEPNVRRNGLEEVDENIPPQGNDRARHIDQDDENLLQQNVVVELHHCDDEGENVQVNVPRTDSTDELLLQA